MAAELPVSRRQRLVFGNVAVNLNVSPCASVSGRAAARKNSSDAASGRGSRCSRLKRSLTRGTCFSFAALRGTRGSRRVARRGPRSPSRTGQRAPARSSRRLRTSVASTQKGRDQLRWPHQRAGIGTFVHQRLTDDSGFDRVARAAGVRRASGSPRSGSTSSTEVCVFRGSDIGRPCTGCGRISHYLVVEVDRRPSRGAVLLDEDVVASLIDDLFENTLVFQIENAECSSAGILLWAGQGSNLRPWD
jgi:hypothetical protein